MYILFSGEENGNPLQYSCLENPMDRGPWRATVHGVTKSQTRLKQLSTHAYITLRVIKRRKQPVAVEKDRRVLDLDGAILDNFSEELAPSEDVNDIVMPPEWRGGKSRGATEDGTQTLIGDLYSVSWQMARLGGHQSEEWKIKGPGVHWVPAS